MSCECWRNPETGYMEYCSYHEGFIADVCYLQGALNRLGSATTYLITHRPATNDWTPAHGQAEQILIHAQRILAAELAMAELLMKLAK